VAQNSKLQSKVNDSVNPSFRKSPKTRGSKRTSPFPPFHIPMKILLCSYCTSPPLEVPSTPRASALPRNAEGSPPPPPFICLKKRAAHFHTRPPSVSADRDSKPPGSSSLEETASVSFPPFFPHFVLEPRCWSSPLSVSCCRAR